MSSFLALPTADPDGICWRGAVDPRLEQQ